MAIGSEDAIKQLSALLEQLEEPLRSTFQNVHQGYPRDTLVRFLKARDWNVAKAHKMLLDCLNWRVENSIDDILSKPILPVDLYRAVRDTQLVGFTGYTKEGLPVFAYGVGQSTFDKASVHYYLQSHIQMNEYRDRVVLPAASKKYGRNINTCLKVLDMTGLKLSALHHIKLLTTISTVDDLDYPEKAETYYIVNAPYIFSSCWKVVKPLLQERTRKKVKVLSGSGRDELLKVMDEEALPHFCKKQGSGSSKYSSNSEASCFSLDHLFHQQLYSYIKQQQAMNKNSAGPERLGSLHVDVPDLEESKIIETIESKLHEMEAENGLSSYPVKVV